MDRSTQDAPFDMSPRVRRLVSLALTKAAETTGGRVLGTEHLLFALASDSDGIAGQVLNELGVRERVAARLDEIMRRTGYRTKSTNIAS